jgi:hypothetical protein
VSFSFSHKYVKNREISAHGDGCLCGCASPLANNRKFEASHEPRGFESSLKTHVSSNEQNYHQDIDALAFSGASKPSITLDSFILSKIVGQMEANTEFFPKGTDKAVAGNCSKRVMPPKLRQKILGHDYYNSPDYEDTTVDIIDYQGSFSFSGVMCCHNVWGCPICARKISERRRKGLSDLLTAHFAEFGSKTVTASLFTIPHGLGDDLVDIKTRLLHSFRKMTQSGSYKLFMKKFGYCGISRALEVTYSLVNGFHPHIHVLHFFEKPLSLDDQILLFETLFSMWSKYLIKNEFKAPVREGFGCQLVSSDKGTIADVAEYFSKVESEVNDDDIKNFMNKKGVRSVKNAEGRDITGWQAEHEMTKWHLKRAKEDKENPRYSMLDFIRGYSIASTNGDDESRKKFRALWLSYRKAFKGSSQLFTRHKHFKISELFLSDSDLGEQSPEDNQAKVVYRIPFQIWLMVVYMGARGSVLESARIGGFDKVDKTLKLIRDGYDCLPKDRRILSFTG